MTLDEQRNTMERALGERMINHTLFFLRQWAKELGFGPYSDRIQSLSDSYNRLFDYYLAADDPEREEIHNELTQETYALMDEMYADIRIKRGLVPQLTGFDPQDANSVVRYFSTCAHFQEEDFDWLFEVANDPERSTMAVRAFASLCNNLHDNFQANAVAALIDLIGCENELLSEQALVHSIITLAQWDIRVDFYPDIQQAFLEQIGDGDIAFMALRAIIKSVNSNVREMIEKNELTEEDIPDELREIINEETGGNEEEKFLDKLNRASKWLPQTSRDFLAEIVDILPDTWVYDVIVGEDEEREMFLQELYLHIGSMALMWDRWEEAEEWLLERLRTNKATALDYMNYGHCCFLRGDRMMAYENYLESKRLCKNTKQFYDIFRPERKMLVEKGIPLEQVYLMEDQLLQNAAR